MDLASALSQLTQARDEALPAPPVVTPSPALRSGVEAFLMALSAAVGARLPVPPRGLAVGAPAPLQADLWAAILMAVDIVGGEIPSPDALPAWLKAAAAKLKSAETLASLSAEV